MRTEWKALGKAHKVGFRAGRWALRQPVGYATRPVKQAITLGLDEFRRWFAIMLWGCMIWVFGSLTVRWFPQASGLVLLALLVWLLIAIRALRRLIGLRLYHAQQRQLYRNVDRLTREMPQVAQQAASMALERGGVAVGRFRGIGDLPDPEEEFRSAMATEQRRHVEDVTEGSRTHIEFVSPVDGDGSGFEPVLPRWLHRAFARKRKSRNDNGS